MPTVIARACTRRAVDDDPALIATHGLSIPVVEIDGVVRFRGQVSEVLLRRLIEATEPR